MSIDIFLPWKYDFHSPASLRLAYVQVNDNRTLVAIDNMCFIITRQQLLEILEATKPFYDAISDEEIERYNKAKLEGRLPIPKPTPRPMPVDTKIAGYVYLLKAGPYYKIGASKDVTERIKQLSTIPPFDLELVHTIPSDDMYSLEKTLHDRFSHRHKNGEWFELTKTEVEYVIDKYIIASKE